MEFNGQYLTYSEYTNLGGTLEEMPFNLLEFRSRKEIDNRTNSRLKNFSEQIQDVKLCDYVLIEKINIFVKSENRDRSVSSENTDGYSVSYVSASQIKEIVSSKQAELQDMIMTELYGVIVNGEHIIYNGVLQ